MVRLVVVESRLWTVSVVGGIGIATFGILRWIGNKLSAFVSNSNGPPPPFNPWWSDLPLSFTGKLIEALLNSKIKSKGLRIPDVVQGWSPEQKLEDIGLIYLQQGPKMD